MNEPLDPRSIQIADRLRDQLASSIHSVLGRGASMSQFTFARNNDAPDGLPNEYCIFVLEPNSAYLARKLFEALANCSGGTMDSVPMQAPTIIKPC